MFSIDLNSFDLSQLPPKEDDRFEFKSSLIGEDRNKLKKELSIGVSAFANSGGGCVVVGVSNEGIPDGGISTTITRKPLEEWVDTVIHQDVEPGPIYEKRLICDAGNRGVIKPNHSVLVVAVRESDIAPHMAYKQRYYIRAGAHSEPARHFLVEAIRAKRHFQKPRLSHIVRLKPNSDVVQLGIVAVTDAPAVDVELPRPSHATILADIHSFPLQIPLIDKQHPFYMDLIPLHAAWSEQSPLSIRFTYHGLNGEQYQYEKMVHLPQAVPPVHFYDTGTSGYSGDAKYAD